MSVLRAMAWGLISPGSHAQQEIFAADINTELAAASSRFRLRRVGHPLSSLAKDLQWAIEPAEGMLGQYGTLVVLAKRLWNASRVRRYLMVRGEHFEGDPSAPLPPPSIYE